VRVWVGNTLVVDDWHDREASWSFVDHVIPKGPSTSESNTTHDGGATWRGEYINNRDLSGAPALVRFDTAIDFD
jgi:hypothetical protein